MSCCEEEEEEKKGLAHLNIMDLTGKVVSVASLKGYSTVV